MARKVADTATFKMQTGGDLDLCEGRSVESKLEFEVGRKVERRRTQKGEEKGKSADPQKTTLVSTSIKMPTFL